ncbi:MAG: transglutaminase family protein [Puniceicoccaceae bacterium]|nr:MAG: transglutaminase family protein [Puniceicoccaceae bacterium]
MKQICIQHVTEYSFSQPVELREHRLLLRPREGHDIRIVASKLEVNLHHTIKWYRDVYGNSVGVLHLAESGTRLRIASEVRIEHYQTQPLDFIVDERVLTFPFAFEPEDRMDLLPYRTHIWPNNIDPLKQWVSQFWRPGQSIETYVLLTQMNRQIVAEFKYLMREEAGVQSHAETLQKRSGSCRDFAAFFIEACRYLGLAARFVSGYLHNPGSNQHGSTHAWSEVYLPGAGWVGFDNTSGQIAGASHIATAVHRHPEAVPPVSGTFVSNQFVETSLDVQVSVT